MDAGHGKRPESYGDPVAEVLAVRQRVGLIDVSTLGKIEVAGPDAARLLDQVYINKFADLKIGRARYGVMCNEDGIIFDDGVCARLADGRFYLTATTGNAEGVFQWLELWRATWQLRVRIYNHTSSMAAMNLAGPMSRDILGRITTLDVSNRAFPYMAAKHADLAGIPCRLLRIGFVGELGYEIHCPVSLAWSLWDVIRDAGREFGLAPFGVEAQRILRLEKGHLIIGADTDALSNPFEAGLESLVRFEKSEFIGRAPLWRMKQRGARMRLVGFVIPDRKEPLPEGTQVVENGYPVGRLTSSRMSPTLGASVGLAWIPAGRAAPGSRFSVRWNRSDIDAVVVALPFFDPAGERLRM
jgi:sarcosine oxidase subunit alpha